MAPEKFRDFRCHGLSGLSLHWFGWVGLDITRTGVAARVALTQPRSQRTSRREPWERGWLWLILKLSSPGWVLCSSPLAARKDNGPSMPHPFSTKLERCLFVPCPVWNWLQLRVHSAHDVWRIYENCLTGHCIVTFFLWAFLLWETWVNNKLLLSFTLPCFSPRDLGTTVREGLWTKFFCAWEKSSFRPVNKLVLLVEAQ